MNKPKQIFFSYALEECEWTAEGRRDRSTSRSAGPPNRRHSRRVDKGSTGGQNENASMYV